MGTTPLPTPKPADAVPAAAAGVAPETARASRRETIKTIVILIIAAAVLSVVFAVALGWEIPLLNKKASAENHKVPVAPLKVELVQDPANPKALSHTLLVPEEVRKTLRIRQGNVDVVAIAKEPTSNQTIELPGSTALNPARIARIRVRFPTNGTEVVSIGRTPDSYAPTTYRELRPGDVVKSGQELATFYSVDVGSKKNDLIDAICQLKLDQAVYDKSLAAKEAIPEVLLLNAQRAVAGDVNTINRAVRTLETWNVPPEDIKAIREEAEEISKLISPGQGLRPPVNPERERKWGQVTLRAPIDGVIVERNVTEKEVIVDNTVNVFQIANVDDLLVMANVPEDQLPRLREIKEHRPLTWTVRTAGAPPKTGIPGTVDEISYLIDPMMHTAVFKGLIKNERGALRAGQYVTASIELPREKDVVEVPMAAIADDGRQTVVFVQEDPSKPQYTMRRVKVTHRFDKVAYVSTVLSEEDIALGEAQAKEQGLLPFSTLKEKDRLLMSGLLELKKELDDREASILATGKN